MKKGKLSRILTAVLSTAAVLTMAVSPTAAAETSLPEELQTATINTFCEDEVVTTLKGYRDVFSSSQLQIDAGIDITADSQPVSVKTSFAIDKSTLNESLKGTVSTGGINIDFHEYLDDTHLALSVPMLFQTPLSYDFTNDNIEGAFADYASILTQVNAGIRAVREAILSGMLNAETIRTAIASYNETIEAKMSELVFTEIEGKDCQAGSGTVACAAYRTELDGAFLGDLFDIMLNTPLAEGAPSLLEAMQMAASYAESSGGTADISELETLPDQAREIGGIIYEYYYGGDFLREMDVTVKETPEDEGQTVEVCFTGEDIPWHDTVVSSDSGESFELHTTEEGSVTTYTLSENGAAVLACSYDTASGEYSVISSGTPLVSGTLTGTDTGFSLTADFIMPAAGKLSLDVSGQADIQPIEGETIEITKATQEELAPIIEVINAITGSAGAASPAA